MSTSDNSESSNSDRAIKWFDGLHGDQMVWDGIREYNLDEFPEVTFRWLSDHLYAVTDEETVPLYAGMPIWSVYFCDLTGDGKPDLCSTISIGSGMTREAVEATIRICKDKDYLREYLSKREKEATTIMTRLFDQELATELYGKRMAREAAKEANRATAERMIRKGQMSSLP